MRVSPGSLSEIIKGLHYCYNYCYNDDLIPKEFLVYECKRDQSVLTVSRSMPFILTISRANFLPSKRKASKLDTKLIAFRQMRDLVRLSRHYDPVVGKTPAGSSAKGRLTNSFTEN